MRIGVDLLGSDSPPETLLQAAVQAQSELPSDVNLVLFGLPQATEGLELIPVSQEITTDDSPLHAVRRKRDSSIIVALEMMKRGDLDGFVSAGNTGALVAGATLTLPLLPTIGRPGLLACLPTLTGSVAVMDIGGNVHPKPEHFWQYARMGSAYQSCTEKIKRPKVALLNIGTEAVKGTKGTRDAYRVLAEGASDLFEFVGNIEGREVFMGGVDVLVCGGFAGNIFLKTAEGISAFILESLGQAFGEDLTDEISTILTALKRRVHYAEYPGALICGVDGVVVKCHGFSSAQAMTNGIKGAANLIHERLVSSLKTALQT